MNRLILVVAGLVVEQLFHSYDGVKSFDRKELPYGIQGVQELDWNRQNAELAPAREEFLSRSVQGRLLETIDGKHWRWFGNGSLVVIDETMPQTPTVGLVKYRFHAFDVGFPRRNTAWQMFVNVKHRDWNDFIAHNPVVSDETSL